MKLEVGKRYVRRDGKVTGPIELYNHEQYHFRDSMHAHTYHESGVWSLVEKTERDLISEYIEPEVVKDEVKTLRDEFAMAAPSNDIEFMIGDMIGDTIGDTIGTVAKFLGIPVEEYHYSTHYLPALAKARYQWADAMLAARKERA